ncbi:hypothetical protein [Vibrio sp. EA2]|uniref:hypothetical protein n=1 Tax=Vibrio sp. EA2 TaxID=3079860 RepID=UPI002949666C|nr:hypothetical protein [Vibrio sp. EA2]MDV6250066.1 hypothetical protein [Vibrio sp. EA2]
MKLSITALLLPLMILMTVFVTKAQATEYSQELRESGTGAVMCSAYFAYGIELDLSPAMHQELTDSFNTVVNFYNREYPTDLLSRTEIDNTFDEVIKFIDTTSSSIKPLTKACQNLVATIRYNQ